MTRQVSHDRNKQRGTQPSLGPYYGSPDESIGYLVKWLNESGSNTSPVHQLLDTAQQLSRLSHTSPKASPRRITFLLDEINSCLEQYRAVRTVFVHDRGIGAYWGLPHAKLSGADEWLIQTTPTGGDKSRQHQMIHIVVDALQHGWIERIALCQCGRFFFARFSHSRFCSAECRVAFWESSPERKAQKRKKAREYYQLHRYGNTK
jgi:hypothetical protein